MSYQSFENITKLLVDGQIVNFNIDKSIDLSDSVVATFLDLNGNQWHCIVQYHKINNMIYPPAPSVINLKGTIHQYGASLEHAPPNMVYIGRNLTMGGWGLPKSKWHNPFNVKQNGRDEALRKYREHIINTPQLYNSLSELNGKVLACWCHPEPCHGDILSSFLKI